MQSDYILELRGIDKSFPGVKALDQMHFKLREASVHALLGENGAGKSTLMKILTGVYQKDNGEMLIDGKPLVCSNPLEAQSSGISIIYQELNLCWNLTVAENIFLGREPVRKFGYYRKTDVAKAAGNILKSLDVEHIDPNVVVSDLSISNQQMVEIAKAISVNAKILIMDEPTSSLTEKETDILFKLIKNLKKKGVSIIYISHKLEEIYEICDHVTVIRDGKWIEDFPISEATNDRIIELMVGRPMDIVFPQKLVSDSEEVGDPVIRVENMHKHGLVSDISFSVAPGEILGVSGLVGAGRTEMAKTLFGAIKKDRGQIFLEGKEIIINSPQDAIRLGIALITEDRKLDGLFLGLSVKDNILASNLEMVLKSLGFIDRAQERELVEDAVKKLNVKTPSLEFPVSGLSGGNQQKMIISRWLAKHVKVLIMDEPTRGIDVGAKKAIYDIMRMLSKEGIAIIMISSELPEILGMSDRIAVMRSGRIVKIIPGNEASQTLVMKYAAGGGN